MFSKVSFLWVVKSLECVGKSLFGKVKNLVILWKVTFFTHIIKSIMDENIAADAQKISTGDLLYFNRNVDSHHPLEY